MIRFKYTFEDTGVTVVEYHETTLEGNYIKNSVDAIKDGRKRATLRLWKLRKVEECKS